MGAHTHLARVGDAREQPLERLAGILGGQGVDLTRHADGATCVSFTGIRDGFGSR
jgi:hypothetical protein